MKGEMIYVKFLLFSIMSLYLVWRGILFLIFGGGYYFRFLKGNVLLFMFNIVFIIVIIIWIWNLNIIVIDKDMIIGIRCFWIVYCIFDFVKVIYKLCLISRGKEVLFVLIVVFLV